MPATALQWNNGEYISHIAGVRMRIVGTASLQMRLIGLDNVRQYVMKPLPITTAPGLEPTRIANFRSQRTRLEIKTTEINEFIDVSRILIFMKPSATSYPG